MEKICISGKKHSAGLRTLHRKKTKKPVNKKLLSEIHKSNYNLKNRLKMKHRGRIKRKI